MARPCSVTSSPTFTIAVISLGGTTCTKPDSMRAAPTPPARTVIIGSVEGAEAAGEQIEVCVHHHPNQLGERGLGFPAQRVGGLGRIADQEVHLSRSEEALVDDHVFLVVQPCVPERQLAQLAHGM